MRSDGLGSKIRELFVFLSIFILFLVSVQGFFLTLLRTFGVSDELAPRLRFDNEMLIQSVGLALSLGATRFLASAPASRGWKSWLRNDVLRVDVFRGRPDWLRTLGWGLSRGFIGASLLVGAMVFFGHAIIERVGWDLASLSQSLPQGLAQLGVLGLWILARVAARSRLRRVLGLEPSSAPKTELASRLVLIVFESVLLARAFQADGDVYGRLLTYLVCGLLAASFQLWEEAGGAVTRWPRRTWGLWALEFGFLAALFHVYGVPRGELRLESALLVFPGPSAERWGWLAEGSLFSQLGFVAFALILVNLLLHRVWKRGRQRFHG